jgi:hypothetical protein
MSGTRLPTAVVDAPARRFYRREPMLNYLDFEKPIAELEARVRELKETADSGELDIQAEVDKLEAKASKLLTDTYSKLSAWQKAQVARHPGSPTLQGLCRGDHGGVHPACRGSCLFRGSGDHRRFRPHRRSPGDADRP